MLEMELCPLSYILNRTIDLLFACDTEELFHQPVDIEEVCFNLLEILVDRGQEVQEKYNIKFKNIVQQIFHAASIYGDNIFFKHEFLRLLFISGIFF